MKSLDLEAAPIASQVVSRTQEHRVLSTVNEVAVGLTKFAGDVRILQAPAYGEWSEPFGSNQVGSSAMPFKKNPVNAEKVCSLGRYVNQLPAVVAENAAHSYLERTLDDSANHRIVVSEAFLAVDEMLETSTKILDGLVINEARVAYNLAQFGPFAATEAILMEAVKKGADRQELHETLRKISLQAWSEVQAGEPNPMPDALPGDHRLTRWLPAERIRELLDVSRYVGDAPERSRQLARRIGDVLGS